MSEPQPEYLTYALTRSGVLRDGRLSGVAVDSAKPTILSQIIRLRLSYESVAGKAPASLILKTGLAERAQSNASQREVAFYSETPPVASYMRRDSSVATEITRQTPRGRIASPREIANGVLCLCSDATPFMIGSPLVIEDGYMA